MTLWEDGLGRNGFVSLLSGFGWLLPATLGAVLLTLAVTCAPAVDLEAESAKLLQLHEAVLEAHRSGNVESWMAVEAEEIISANRGTVAFPPLAERRAMREAYLGSTTFSMYRDLRPPIVRISEDGTLGWVIVEVEAKGSQTVDGLEAPFESIWAWIELYEKQSGEWRMVGNVSNRRP